MAPRVWPVLVVLVVLVALACVPAPPALPPNPEPQPDRSGELFRPDHVLEVVVELDAADWDALRFQTRTIIDIFGGECLAEPFDDPFTYFPAAVTVDGAEVAEVGVRKKGFLGSLDSDKPSLKVKLDEYVDGQRLLGLSRLTLNNNVQDPAAVRQCLGYSVFAAAGVPAPRCSFAHVVVNGEDLGLYTHVESMDEAFVARHFDDASGDLWEGTLSDFRPGWLGTFEKKTNEDTVSDARLQAVAAVAAGPDDGLVPGLEELVDLEGFFSLWAAEVLLGHWDGYAGNTNNFYLYDDPTTGKLHFLPWGIDQTFMSGPDGASPPAVLSTGILARRLLNLQETRARYVARMGEVLDAAWDEPALRAELDRLEVLLAPHVSEGNLAALDDVRAFVDSRRAAVDLALDAGLAPATDPLREEMCFDDVGDLFVTFATTWGTLGAPDVFAAGSGTMSGTVWGYDVAPTQVGSTGGADGEHPGRAVLQLFGLLADGNVLVVHLELDETLVAAGATALNGDTAIGYLLRYVPATNTTDLLGVLFDGDVLFDAAARTAGAPLTGSLQANVHWFPF